MPPDDETPAYVEVAEPGTDLECCLELAQAAVKGATGVQPLRQAELHSGAALEPTEAAAAAPAALLAGVEAAPAPPVAAVQHSPPAGGVPQQGGGLVWAPAGPRPGVWFARGRSAPHSGSANGLQ